MPKDNIVILYCGSYFTKSLFDKVAYLNQTPILMPSDTPVENIMSLNPKGIMITGSPKYVNDPHCYTVDKNIYDAGVPIFGVCYGMQRMAVDLGGTVKRMAKSEREHIQINFVPNKPSIIYTDFAEEAAPVWMVHTCKVTEMPEGFVATSYTEATEIASMENDEKGFYAVQFHPEHMGRGPANQAGTSMMWAFLRDVCGCTTND